MSQSFFDRPILNSPYEVPTQFHALDDEGQPLEVPPIDGRRPSKVTMSGIVGATEELAAKGVGDQRPSAIAFNLAAHLLKRFAGDDGDLPVHLFGQINRIVRQWLDEGYLVLKGVPIGVLDYLEIKDHAAERIFLACQRFEHGSERIKAILDPYNPKSSSRFVNFTTSKDVYVKDQSFMLPPGGPIFNALRLLRKAHILSNDPAGSELDDSSFEPGAIYLNNSLMEELLAGLADWSMIDVHSGLYMLGTRDPRSSQW